MKFRSIIIVGLLAGCGEPPVEPPHNIPEVIPEDCLKQTKEPNGYQWQLPPGFPRPYVPAENPMTEAKVELGRHLFFDKRLSENETQSCSSCHKQALAFTDGRAHGLGSTGEDHPRSAMSLTNVAYLSTLGWANPTTLRLEEQAIVPIFGINPIELGLRGKEELLFTRLKAEPKYQQLFSAAFPEETDPFTLSSLVRAISSFERTMISGTSPYDRFVGGDRSALSEAADRGRQLFNSERLECFHCHTGFTFQDSVIHACKTAAEIRFHNTGLYNIGGTGDFPAPNTGVHEISGRPQDMGRFRAPTLRNIALTAPYMHDGTLETLEDVLDHYAAGGRKIVDGPNAGDGSMNPLKSGLVRGFEITEAEKADVIEFLNSLTDEEFLADERFKNPWPE
jgi:cytochrome c peroxidase